MGILEGEPSADDHLDDRAVSAIGEPKSDAEIEFPIGRKIEIKRRKKLMLLITGGIKSKDGPERAVVLRSQRDECCHVVTDLDIRRELETLVARRPAQALLQRRIQADIKSSDLLVKDRAELQ